MNVSESEKERVALCILEEMIESKGLNSNQRLKLREANSKEEKEEVAYEILRDRAIEKGIIELGKGETFLRFLANSRGCSMKEIVDHPMVRGIIKIGLENIQDEINSTIVATGISRKKIEEFYTELSSDIVKMKVSS